MILYIYIYIYIQKWSAPHALISSLCVDDIQPWMIWGYYVSPMMYGQNAIAINEFLDERWSAVRSQKTFAKCHFVSFKTTSFHYLNSFSLLQPNPDPNTPEPTVGKVLLGARGMFKEDYWYWICVGALLGFSLLFNICFMLALTFLNRKQSFPTVISISVSAMRFWNLNCML
jgi:hypothetical protein